MTENVSSPLRDLFIMQRGYRLVKEAVWREPVSAEELAKAAITIVNDLHDAALNVDRTRGEEQARKPLLERWPGSVAPVTVCLPDKPRSRRGHRTTVDVRPPSAAKDAHASLFLWLSMFVDLSEYAYSAAASLLSRHRFVLATSSIPQFCKSVFDFFDKAYPQPPTRAGPDPDVVTKAVMSAVHRSGLTIAKACIPLLESWVCHTIFDRSHSSTASIVEGAPGTLLRRSQLLLEYGTALGVWVPMDMRRYWMQQPQHMSNSCRPLRLLPPAWHCSMLCMTLLDANGGFATVVSGGTLSDHPFATSRCVLRPPSFKKRAFFVVATPESF